MPLYIGDYMADTAHLTTEQHGAYLLLIFACWTHGGFLPDDDIKLAAITRLSLDAWKATRDTLAEFFKISGQKWRQKRVRVELERATHLHEVRSKAGSKGGSKTKARARVLQPHIDSDLAGKVRTKAKPKDKNLDLKTSREPPARAHEGPNGSAGEQVTNGHASEEEFLDENWNPLGRFASLAAQAPPKPASPALKTKRKELLRMKLMRFADATMNTADRHKAIAGLCGTDPDHSDQWWLDTLDIRMRAQHWDDVA
jgi:uncharacterized protein YdaU (DUF1376 family)